MYQFATGIVSAYRSKRFMGISAMMLGIWPVIEAFLIGTGVWPLTIFELAIFMIWACLFFIFSPHRARGLCNAEKYLKRRIDLLPGYGTLYVVAGLPVLVLFNIEMWQNGPPILVPLISNVIGAGFGMAILLLRPWFVRIIFGYDLRTKIFDVLNHAR